MTTTTVVEVETMEAVATSVTGKARSHLADMAKVTTSSQTNPDVSSLVTGNKSRLFLALTSGSGEVAWTKVSKQMA